MARKRSYTVTEISRRPTVFQTDKPFDVTLQGEIIATVIGPNTADWNRCEKCGENTQNVISFQDDKLKWKKIILCDKCANELL